MEAVRVKYTVQPDYIEHNKQNIARVMEDVRSLNATGLKYSTFQMEEDPSTFIHVAMFSSPEDRKILGGIESFKNFQKELKESTPVAPPQPLELKLVGSSYDIF